MEFLSAAAAGTRRPRGRGAGCHIVVFLTQFDRDGHPYTPRELGRAVIARSSAPVYGISEGFVGTGAVAGMVDVSEECA